jgi:hypothetical protein
MHPHPHPTKSTPLERLAVAAVTVILLFLASGLGQCGAAVADDRRVETRTLDEQTTILARFLVGESGAHVPDYAALLHTMRRRLETLRRPWTYLELVERYSAPLRERGRWIRALPVLPHARFGPTWQRALDTAAAYLAGRLPDPCRHPSTHFGSQRDVARRFPAGKRADCGLTYNVFLY